MRNSNNLIPITPVFDDYPLNRAHWLTTAEAARYLRKSPNAIRILVHRGHLRARKLGSRLYFKRSEIDQLLENAIL